MFLEFVYEFVFDFLILVLGYLCCFVGGLFGVLVVCCWFVIEFGFGDFC